MYARRSGFGQAYSTDIGTDIGIDTSGLTVSTPTPAETAAAQIALVQEACMGNPNGIWDPSTNSCLLASPSTSSPAGILPSANNCANNPNPGTFWDVNCPFYCLVGGTGLWGGNDCFPCSNICPAGTNWDTTNYVCSSNPITTKCVGGVSGQPNPLSAIPAWAWIGLGIGAVLLIVPKLVK